MGAAAAYLVWYAGLFNRWVWLLVAVSSLEDSGCGVRTSHGWDHRGPVFAELLPSARLG